MKSNDESAGETFVENIEIEQPSVLSTVTGMNSNSDSLSENVVGKTSPRASNASASDCGVLNSKSGGRVPEGHDDCLSGVSGTNEHATNKFVKQESMMKYDEQSKVRGVSSTQVQNNFSPTSNGIYVSVGEYSKDVKDVWTSSKKNELLDGSTEPRDLISLRGVEVCGDPPATALNSIQNDDHVDVEAQPIDEMQESEMMEQDVKVCDICGDAGREDLLAICSRCSDGAEHTYCMREMLTKVPEGEWLCEECQAQQHVAKIREEKIERMDKIENNNSDHTSSEHVNNSDADGQKIKVSTGISRKRHRHDDDAEVSSSVKRPALESKLGSLTSSNYGKTAVLTRENSVKGIDKGRLQTQDIAPVNDTTESGSSSPDLRVHSFRGTFSKSKSFSSLNSKPKVKLVDQAVILRQKSAKEPSSFRHKEVVVRSLGKSMSFKSTNSVYSESKVKMLSPRLSPVQDIKNTKQRSLFGRQHAFRTERSSISSMMGTSVSTSRIVNRPSSLVTVANNHEMKPVQAGSKPATTLSRPSSLAARNAAHLTSSSGEFKRPSIHTHCNVRGPSANGISSNENKVNPTNLKSDFIVTEKSALNVEGAIPAVLARSTDLTTSRERMKDCSGSRAGPLSAMSARDEGDNLKATIEAAALTKPGVFWKNKAVNQSDASCVPTLGVEVICHQDPISSFARNKNSSSDAALPERPTISHKQGASDSARKSSPIPVEGLSSAVRDGAHISSSRRDVINTVPAQMPLFLKTLAFPELEYIWQGSFEICRSGKTNDSWDGIQAHLSTCASHKVTDVVNKFNSRISLYEVSRSSAWPIHFQEHGVREDNIALFFFAKDLDSYDKIYKVFLDNMMKNDLALKGNVNGVELLIFPSSLLPDNSQRWNMLFFLWGVFRGNKESCGPQTHESPNQFCNHRSMPPPIMSLPENRCLPRPIAGDLNGSEGVASRVLETRASKELQRLLSSRDANRDCDTKSLDQLDHQLIYVSPPAVHSDNANQCQDMIGTSQERDTSSSCNPRPLVAKNCSISQKPLVQLDTPVIIDLPIKSAVGMPEEYVNEASKLYEMGSPQIPAKTKTVLKDRHLDSGDVNLELEHKRWILNPKEKPVVPSTLFGEATKLPPFKDPDDDIREIANNHHNFALNHSVTAPERRFFPTIELQLPWKHHHHHLLDQEKAEKEEHRVSDGEAPPDLELALGAAERKSLTPATIQPFDLMRMGSKVVNNRKASEVEDGGAKVEDDVAASLSLSLSFPFPEKEMTSKQETNRVQRGNKTPMLLFGNLRDD